MSEPPDGERTKQSMSMDDLMEVLMSALRAHPECDVFRVEKIMPVANAGGVANWDATFVADSGERPTLEQRRAMLAAKFSVQKRLDLAEGGG